MTINYEDLLGTFASILYEAMPFIVLGVIIAGVLEEFVPQQLIANLFESRALSSRTARLGAIALGALLGLVFPMCECGIVPIMQRLLRKGVPVGVCISYMLAGPIINVVVIGATYVAFSAGGDPQAYLFPLQLGSGSKTRELGGPLAVTGLRVGLGFLVACVTGVVVEWQYRRQGKKLFTPGLLDATPPALERPEQSAERKPLVARLGSISETALHDFVDIMAFLVIGAALAAVVRTSLQPATQGGQESDFNQWIQTTPAVAILLLMGLAIAICLCSEADAFVAAAFPTIWPPAAKVAFVVLGPMLDFKLLLMYTRVFRQRLIWTIVVTVVIQVFVYTLLLHYLWDHHGYPPQLWSRMAP
jgi:uncharacterized membrane protein YraQ (UPF0718 family)